MSDSVQVRFIPSCDIHAGKHETVPAFADARMRTGQWANMCQSCFDYYGVGLGTGKGQRYVLATDKPVLSAAQERRAKQSAINEAIESGDFDTVEDLIGDGDLAEWL